MNTGRARFVYRHFSFLGEESVWAAEATECAAEQGRFWDYHDIFFERWTGSAERGGNYEYDYLVGLATSIGLNTPQFAECMSDRRYLDRVRADTEYALNVGVTTTPSVFINDVRVRGSDYETFSAAIDEAINTALGTPQPQ